MSRIAAIPSLVVRVDEQQLAYLHTELKDVANGVPRAIVGAINKTGRKGKTLAVNQLASLLTAKRGNILRRTDYRPATMQSPVGVIRILGRVIALINFWTRDRRKKKGWGTAKSGTGVEYQIYKNDPKQVLPHAFIAEGRKDQDGGTAGNKHVFQRASNAAGKRVPRFPIISLKGVSLLRVYQQHPEYQQELVGLIRSDLDVQLRSQVDRLLKRPKSPPPTE